LDGDTGFEIGSVTKVFTALLLADLVRKGEVALADPVAKYLPAVKIRNGSSITLLSLATHTSGLPFMPDDVPAFDDSAATKCAAAQLYQFLASYELPRHRGTKWDYSNIGYWLLGQAGVGCGETQAGRPLSSTGPSVGNIKGTFRKATGESYALAVRDEKVYQIHQGGLKLAVNTSHKNQ
jgi:hypothetical protein